MTPANLTNDILGKLCAAIETATAIGSLFVGNKRRNKAGHCPRLSGCDARHVCDSNSECLSECSACSSILPFGNNHGDVVGRKATIVVSFAATTLAKAADGVLTIFLRRNPFEIAWDVVAFVPVFVISLMFWAWGWAMKCGTNKSMHGGCDATCRGVDSDLQVSTACKRRCEHASIYSPPAKPSLANNHSWDASKATLARRLNNFLESWDLSPNLVHSNPPLAVVNYTHL